MTAVLPSVDPRPIRGWTVEASCPACGGVLAHQADGRPYGGTARALATCTTCARTWLAEMTLREASTRDARSHGGRASHPADCECVVCTQRTAA